jgi:hypothetical protein
MTTSFDTDLTKGAAPAEAATRADRRVVLVPVLGEAVLLGAYLLRPTLYPAAAIALVVLYLAKVGRAGPFLALIQVGITAGYGSQRAMPNIPFAGFAFTATDMLALPLLVISLFGIPRLIATPASRRLAAGLVVWVIVMLGGVLRTWQVGEDVNLALRYLRPGLYLLVGLGFGLRVLKGTPVANFVVALNLAAAGASLALLAHVLHFVTLIGFDTKELVLTEGYLVRVLIIDETLLPGLISVAVASLLFTSGATRTTGAIATPLLFAALLASPGRGAIFSSAVVVLVLLIASAVWRPVSGPRLAGSRLRNLAIVGGLSYLVLTGALGELAGAGQDLNVVQGRVREGLLPWTSTGISTRREGWQAAYDLFIDAPVVGHGLGHTHREIAEKYDRDYFYNVPTTIGNVAAKGGLFVLLPMLAYFVMLFANGLSQWSRRWPGVELIAAPTLLALFVRSLSDDVLGPLGVGIVLDVVLAAVIATRLHASEDPLVANLDTSARTPRTISADM